MDANRLLIAEMLSAAIRNKKIGYLPNSNYEWDKIYAEAKAQGIHALLYPVLKDLNEQVEISMEVMLKWQKAALSLGMYQLQLMKEVQKIFVRFHDEGIKVIALKGIVLRELYPYPELRSMGDADILVHTWDVDRAKEILIELEFCEGEQNPEHIGFRNKNNIEIELHWSLIGDERFRKAIKLEEIVWENAVETIIFDAPVLMLDKEENLLYIGLHMAKHIINAGFGLRQLSDFTLLYESIKAEVDWNAFFNKLAQLGAQRFFTLLFLACEQLFSIDLPDCRALKVHGGSKYTGLLINEIFDGGLYGYKSQSRTLGSYALRKVKSSGAEREAGRFKYVRQLLFPPAEQLGLKYGYAVNHRLLLPVAWTHRIINNTFRKEFSIEEKISFSKQYRKRSELLGWLDIR